MSSPTVCVGSATHQRKAYLAANTTFAILGIKFDLLKRIKLLLTMSSFLLFSHMLNHMLNKRSSG